MYYYIDFNLNPDDRIVRMTFVVENIRRGGWATLRLVQRQTEGFPRLQVESPQVWRARVSKEGGERSFKIVGSEFGSPGWWLDLTPSPELPTLAPIALAGEAEAL